MVREKKGERVMTKKKAAKAKAKATRGVRSLPAKKLSAKAASGVKGGRPMIVKMNDVIITGVTHGGSD